MTFEERRNSMLQLDAHIESVYGQDSPRFFSQLARDAGLTPERLRGFYAGHYDLTEDEYTAWNESRLALVQGMRATEAEQEERYRETDYLVRREQVDKHFSQYPSLLSHNIGFDTSEPLTEEQQAAVRGTCKTVAARLGISVRDLGRQLQVYELDESRDVTPSEFHRLAEALAPMESEIYRENLARGGSK
jgi:hypothetical protein